MKKVTTLFAVLMCFGIFTSAHAEGITVEKFTHQNVVGSQTCYGDDTEEKNITVLPDVVMGMRINNPIIRAYIKADTEKTVTIKAEQYNKFGRLLKADEQSVSLGEAEEAFEFNRVRNADSVKIYADNEYIGCINDTVKYENGMSFTEAPSDYQIYQRGEDNKATVTLSGSLEDITVSGIDEHILINDNSVTVNFEENQKTATVIAAEYEDSGVLKRITAKDKKEDENNVIINSDSQLENVKVFVWESLTSMKPIVFSDSSAASVTVSAVNKVTSEKITQTVSAADTFRAELSLPVGLYDITADCGKGEKTFRNVGIGDIWVAAGQSNMTDMGAVTDGWIPDNDDPITDNMHIIYAEDTTWHKMSHPAGEGRFFKTGVRTSPVTSFARIVSESENIPVGIVQSSVGGTNIYQWAKGIKSGDATDGYLLNALKSCFDNMPSTKVKGILWYQGCNDAITENYAYNYDKLEAAIFTQMRDFFGADTPIITTQINDANQDSTASLGYYDAWSYVKDIQRRNPELFDNVYVVGTGAFDLGDTIHNSAKSNTKIGGAWANVALNRIYGHNDIQYLHPTIDGIEITDEHTLTLTFKNIGLKGLYERTDTKRLAITNGLHTIQLGDLKQEFTVRQGSTKTPTASNVGKGTTLTITNAVLNDDLTDGKQTVTLTVSEEMAGTIAVDCCWGKRFVPTLTDKASGWSVLTFYNVIADWGGDAPAAAEPVIYDAVDTALISQGAITVSGFPQTLTADIPANTASDRYMYLNTYNNSSAYPLVKFNLTGLDIEHINSAKLRIYTDEINKERNGDISVYEAGTSWTNASVYSDYGSITKSSEPIKNFIGVNTSSVFPQGNYSDIDITEYISSLQNPAETAFTVKASHVAVAIMSGVNSEHKPQLVIQPGKKTEIVYTCDGQAAKNVKVTIAGTGQTEYLKEFTTDDEGKINAVLVEGTYKAVTTAGEYQSSENRFTITEDGAQSFTLTKNERIPSKIVISGGSAQAPSGTKIKQFTAELYDENDIKIESGIVWNWSCDNGAAVENGVVTIPDDAGENEIITLTVEAVFNGITVTQRAEITVKEITEYTFGSEYIAVKSFDTSNASDALAGDTGITVSSVGGNWNGVSLRNSTSAKEGYYPFTNTFKAADDKYYLFAGVGGSNNNEVITLKLVKTIPAGKTITIKLARVIGSNGSQRKDESKKNEIIIGSQTIDLRSYEYDTWQTETVTSTTDVSEIKLNLGAWSAVAIESIKIGD